MNAEILIHNMKLKLHMSRKNDMGLHAETEYLSKVFRGEQTIYRQPLLADRILIVKKLSPDMNLNERIIDQRITGLLQVATT